MKLISALASLCFLCNANISIGQAPSFIDSQFMHASFFEMQILKSKYGMALEQSYSNDSFVIYNAKEVPFGLYIDTEKAPEFQHVEVSAFMDRHRIFRTLFYPQKGNVWYVEMDSAFLKQHYK